MPELRQFTGENFQLEVLQSDTPVLVDFTAEWCAPCRMLAPVVEQLNGEWNGAVKVGHLDADIHTEMVMAYGVLSLPTLILFKNGQPVERRKHVVRAVSPSGSAGVAVKRKPSRSRRSPPCRRRLGSPPIAQAPRPQGAAPWNRRVMDVWSGTGDIRCRSRVARQAR